MTCNDSAMASVTSGGMTSASLTWEKLSPAEFQQLQDFAACKSSFCHENWNIVIQGELILEFIWIGRFGSENIMTKYFAVFTLKNWYARSFTFLLIFHQNNSIWQEVTALWKKWLVCRPFPKTVILFTKTRILLSTAVTTLTHTIIDLTGFRFHLPSTF